MSNLTKRLRDFENEGITSSDRFHLRNEAAERIEALEADAARYRWLRGEWALSILEAIFQKYGVRNWQEQERALDAAIDAARKDSGSDHA